MRKIPLLIGSAIKFPETNQALEDPNGLLAAGGSLNKETLLDAYKNGIFPWFEDNSPIEIAQLMGGSLAAHRPMQM